MINGKGPSLPARPNRPTTPLKLLSGEQWFCSACSAMLGVHDTRRNTIKLKYKDWYVTIHLVEGRVTLPCRKCGEFNTISAVKSLTV